MVEAGNVTVIRGIGREGRGCGWRLLTDCHAGELHNLDNITSHLFPQEATPLKRGETVEAANETVIRGIGRKRRGYHLWRQIGFSMTDCWKVTYQFNYCLLLQEGHTVGAQMMAAAVNEVVIIEEIKNLRNYSVYVSCKLIERTKDWPVGTNQQRLPTGLFIPESCQPNTHILEQIQREQKTLHPSGHITQKGRVLPITTTLE